MKSNLCKFLSEIIKQKEIVKLERDELFDEDQEWLWSEGNYSCDCNRALFFGMDFISGCSDGKFSVNIMQDGVLVYKEYDEKE